MGIINLFLKAELTCIPGVLHRYFGKYYNNTLCNAATWIFLLWCILHLVFDQFLHSLFRKMKYKTYLRERLLASVWYLGFYSSVLFYTGATLFRNDTEFFKLRIGQVPYDVISSQSIIGFIVILTFLLHSALWESLKNGSVICSASYGLLVLFTLLAHHMRVAELAFSQIAILSVGQVLLNSTKCLDILLSNMLPNSVASILLVKFMMFASILAIIGGYILTIPLTVLPFVVRIVTSLPNLLIYLCFSSLIAFLVSSAYKSIIHRLIIHWLNHHDIENEEDACKNTIDCILYEPRTDVAYTLSIMRKEAKLRKAANIPNSRNKLMHTLKCVIAIKRKLQQQRQPVSASPQVAKVTKPDSSVEITDVTNENQYKDNENVVEDLTGAQHSSTGSESPAIITYDDAQKSKCDFRLNLRQPTPTITITDITDSHENEQEDESHDSREPIITPVVDSEGNRETHFKNRDDVPSITITDFSTPKKRKHADHDDDGDEDDTNENSANTSDQETTASSSDAEEEADDSHISSEEPVQSEEATKTADSEKEPAVYIEANTDPSIETSQFVHVGSNSDNERTEAAMEVSEANADPSPTEKDVDSPGNNFKSDVVKRRSEDILFENLTERIETGSCRSGNDGASDKTS